jgi:parallel beta-helix repeat protein
VHTSNSKLTNNIIANNSYGVDLITSGNNTISGNTIVNNDRGVELLLSSSHNIFFENTISMNNYGAVFYYGSSNNKFYHNSFTQNSEQVSFPFLSYNNIWDNGYPSGGNYWSDYHGSDLNNSRLQNVPGNDGIGDRSYIIDANNKDNYPLMGVFSDFNATSEHHVQTICNSSISDFQFNGTAMSFNVTGKNSTIGFCRICIPTALVNCTYRVFVNGTEILPSPLPLPFSNTMHSYLYFTYHHSTQEVIIIPEFPSFLFLALFIIATLLAVTVYRRKQKRQATLHLL